MLPLPSIFFLYASAAAQNTWTPNCLSRNTVNTYKENKVTFEIYTVGLHSTVATMYGVHFSFL